MVNKKRGETVCIGKYFAAPHNMKPCDGMFSPRMVPYFFVLSGFSSRPGVT